MTPPVCVLDFETRSRKKLGRGGTNAFVYAQDPTSEVWLGKFGFDDEPELVYNIGFKSECPRRLRQHVENGGVICAHNAAFEYAVWNLILVPRYGWPKLPIEQMSDTAARVARLGLPRDLDRATKSLNLSQNKDMEGNQRMKRMAKPRKVITIDTCGGMDTGAIEMAEAYELDDLTYTVVWDGDEAIVYEWWAVDDRMRDLDAYCEQDYHAQMELHQTIPELPEAEFEIWQATMRANIRGCQLDTGFIDRAKRMVDMKLEEHAKELIVLSGGSVKSHTDLGGMKNFMSANGWETDSLDKNAVASFLADDSVPDRIKRMLQIRSESGKSSVAKYPAMQLHVSDDGIARDQLMYYGALATGRWSALGFQLHNLPSRGGVPYDDAEWAISLINGARDAAELRELIPHIEAVLGGSIIEILSMCLRGAIRARDGMKIVCADYSNIEGRFAAWLGGEEWKLAAFRAYDAGTGPDLYKVAAGGILGVDPDDVSKRLRDALGKVSELALQFQGGVGAFLSMAANYRVEIADYWTEIQQAVSADVLEQTKEAWEDRGKGSGIDRTTWQAAEAVKIAWRAKHPGIVQAWRDIEDAAVAAVTNPGTPYYACGKKLALFAKSIQGKMFLLLRLPSGRCIHYANAKLKDRKTPWGSVKKQIIFDKVEQGRVLRSATYGGDMFQSSVQGGARDIMAHGWLNTEKEGYNSLFSVHDEMASEIEEILADLDQYTSLLCDIPAWAAGCPVTASGYISDRFRKD